MISASRGGLASFQAGSRCQRYSWSMRSEHEGRHRGTVLPGRHAGKGERACRRYWPGDDDAAVRPSRNRTRSASHARSKRRRERVGPASPSSNPSVGRPERFVWRGRLPVRLELACHRGRGCALHMRWTGHEQRGSQPVGNLASSSPSSIFPHRDARSVIDKLRVFFPFCQPPFVTLPSSALVLASFLAGQVLSVFPLHFFAWLPDRRS